jgi:hypothetical protein
MRCHLILHQVKNATVCQVHVASSAIAEYIFGFTAGTNKYLTTYASEHCCITFGPHPQVYLMGCNKNLTTYPPGVREIIAENLVTFYGAVDEAEVMPY